MEIAAQTPEKVQENPEEVKIQMYVMKEKTLQYLIILI